MDQSYHGGSCCGMTHIFGFPAYPTTTMAPVAYLNKTQMEVRGRLGQARLRNNGFSFQTAIERLREIIRGIEQGTPQDPTNIYAYQMARPKGCIEIVLTPDQCDNWQATLEELDFKVVNTFVNSNSHRTLTVFHRNSGAKGVRPISDTVATPVPASTPAAPAPTSPV